MADQTQPIPVLPEKVQLLADWVAIAETGRRRRREAAEAQRKLAGLQKTEEAFQSPRGAADTTEDTK